MQALQQHSWPGNIRELRNAVERAVILAEGLVTPEDLPATVLRQGADEGFSLAAVEKSHIRKILAYTGNNKTKTAQLLGIGLATLYRKLDEYGLNK